MTEPTVSYRIKRSARRRTVSLEVRDAQLLVRAPLGVSERELHRLVQRKAKWVQSKLQAQEQLLAQVPEYRYASGTALPWLDSHLTLEVGTAATGGAERRQQTLWVGLSDRSRLAPEEQARRLVHRWYREQALALLSTKTHRLAERIDRRCSGVKVRLTRSKWGHCTVRGEIQYNWHIVLAPESVVDYLVAHEVSHLRHHNHSRAFWQQVEQLCPDYRRQREWLKAKGRLLVL